LNFDNTFDFFQHLCLLLLFLKSLIWVWGYQFHNRWQTFNFIILEFLFLMLFILKFQFQLLISYLKNLNIEHFSSQTRSIQNLYWTLWWQLILKTMNLKFLFSDNLLITWSSLRSPEIQIQSPNRRPHNYILWLRLNFSGKF